ncbi:MAG TPA: carboxypeptidase-like regulatory domain-containing protein, partial [Bacteroidia bacterium]|nr:carboxypeptidase-like regulatory domain-containing protein [Bacteroidia bacterium]
MLAQNGTKAISGIVTTNGIPVPFANIGIYGTTMGTVSDENGKFLIDKLQSGSHEIRVSYIGYEDWTRTVTISKNETIISIRVNLKPGSKLLDEIVITGTRGEKRRLDSAIPVNILTSKVLESTQSLNLSEGLSFQPGIRIEKDCQTCNYTQVRMNGLPGAYSQILINSRPLFSSLAGLYGLEQLPTSMIERVEIVKGGGSVLYGSNAIAGTINIITKDPDSKNFEIGTVASSIKGETSDFQTDFYSALVNRKSDAGLSLIISHRNRDSWD